MTNLTKDPGVLKITDEIRKKAEAKAGGYLVSDVILRENGREYQFVDLVMEGGGTLGIALVGFIHALEQADIRFLGIGGSSVGAIVALLTYCCGGRLEEKGERLAGVIGGMNLGEMVDGSYIAKKLSKILGNNKAALRYTRIAFGVLLTLPEIYRKIGLNPGDKLYNWISDRLAEYGVYTNADLRRLKNTLPDGLVNRGNGKKIISYDTRLKIVAADITTGTKAVFPYMAPMYWEDFDEINPACFARASASIPGFFQPFTVTGISNIIRNSKKWDRLGNFTKDLPEKVAFSDGGLISNFPIDLFKKDRVPRAPTIGARLGSKQRNVKEINKIEHYTEQLFNTLIHHADYDFIFKNPVYNDLVSYIDIDEFNWLDFNMSDENKLKLFRKGVEKGKDFLDKFDWPKHKKLRELELALKKYA